MFRSAGEDVGSKRKFIILYNPEKGTPSLFTEKIVDDFPIHTAEADVPWHIKTMVENAAVPSAIGEDAYNTRVRVFNVPNSKGGIWARIVFYVSSFGRDYGVPHVDVYKIDSAPGLEFRTTLIPEDSPQYQHIWLSAFLSLPQE